MKRADHAIENPHHHIQLQVTHVLPRVWFSPKRRANLKQNVGTCQWISKNKKAPNQERFGAGPRVGHKELLSRAASDESRVELVDHHITADHFPQEQVHEDRLLWICVRLHARCEIRIGKREHVIDMVAQEVDLATVGELVEAVVPGGSDFEEHDLTEEIWIVDERAGDVTVHVHGTISVLINRSAGDHTRTDRIRIVEAKQTIAVEVDGPLAGLGCGRRDERFGVVTVTLVLGDAVAVVVHVVARIRLRRGLFADPNDVVAVLVDVVVADLARIGVDTAVAIVAVGVVTDEPTGGPTTIARGARIAETVPVGVAIERRARKSLVDRSVTVVIELIADFASSRENLVVVVVAVACLLGRGFGIHADKHPLTDTVAVTVVVGEDKMRVVRFLTTLVAHPVAVVVDVDGVAVLESPRVG